MNYADVIKNMKASGSPETVRKKAEKFGIKAENTLGIYHKELNALAKEIGKNSELAIELFNSGIYEGRLLCAKIFKPSDLTEPLMEQWVSTFENWEVCDSFSMGVFARSKFALPKIREWTTRKPEFEKRAGFATMAAYSIADKESGNGLFQEFFEIIIRESEDERLYIKKAVNWALRSIGKRNIDLKKQAEIIVEELVKSNNKTASWIGRDAMKEFGRENLRLSDYPRKLYRS